ncbi:MAG TPA: hypothetical protein VLS49_17275 [Usitatibacter sp.]|nr:hypothetical protein [Usitatibacter sp.]
MATQSAPASRPTAVGDLLRLAIPLVLIASAVAGTLWVDRNGGLDAAAQPSSAAESASR